jgi:hypothetical protein
MLRSAEFQIVTLFDEFGEAESRITDPVMIADCGFKNRVLLTGDRDLVHTWAKEIVDASIAVFVKTDNSEGPQQWGPRIIAAREGILHELRRRHKPFTATISREGSISQVRLYEGSRWKGIEIKKKSPSNFYRKK